MPNIFKKFLITPALLAPVLLSSCSLFAPAVAADVLYINNWRERRVDFNPGGSYNFVASDQTAPNAFGKRLNPAIEPAVEFATAVGRDGSLYLAYTTTNNSSQTVTANSGFSPEEALNVYTESVETLTETIQRSIDRKFKKTGTAPAITYTFASATTNSEIVSGKPSPDSGVWVRLLRYSPAGEWSVEFASERPAEFSGIKIAFVPGRTIPYIAAVSNKNRLAVFGKPSQTTPIEFISTPAGSTDLNGGRNPSSVSQLSPFSDGDRLYLSFIEDQRCVVGYFGGLSWVENYFDDSWGGRTPTIFNVAGSQGEVYGVWWNPIDQYSIVAAYSPNAVPSRRWLLVNKQAATEVPKIKSRYYTEFGSPKLDIYLGYAYGATKTFQLARVANNQVYVTAPPVDGYNDRYDFDIDTKGRVLYSRINSLGNIDVGAWTRDLWRTAEQPQKLLPGIEGSARQPFKTFPSSPISAVFVQGTKPHIVFIEFTGYLQLLEGFVSSNP